MSLLLGFVAKFYVNVKHFRDWQLNIALRNSHNGGENEKYDIHGNKEQLLGKNCEVEKLMKLLKDKGLFKNV